MVVMDTLKGRLIMLNRHYPEIISSKIFAMIAMVALSVPSARAVPSYSRQTGLPCSSCHYAPPELTPFGRTFKLEGYTFTPKPPSPHENNNHNAVLQPLHPFPF